MEVTPYVEQPPLSMILHRLGLFSRYVAMAVLGLIFMVNFTGALIPVGGVLVALNLLSAYSVMVSRYRIEWVCALPIIGTNLVALVLLIPLSSGVAIILLVVASLVKFERYVHLTNVAKTLRKLPAKN